jgi:hypothetical protein
MKPPDGVICERVFVYFPIGKDCMYLGEIFLYGKPYQELFDVQIRTRFRCRYLGKNEGRLAERCPTLLPVLVRASVSSSSSNPASQAVSLNRLSSSPELSVSGSAISGQLEARRRRLTMT